MSAIIISFALLVAVPLLSLAVARSDYDDRDIPVGLVDGEPRDEGHAEAGGHDALDGAIVVRLEDHVRLDTARAELRVYLLDRPAGPVRNERLLPDLPKGNLGLVSQR